MALLPFAPLVWSDTEIAATVSCRALRRCSVATLLAMALRFKVIRLGPDRLATVIQDPLTIVVYFAVADAIVG